MTGLVVTGNPPRPMRNAKATGVYRTGHGDFTVTTDDEGRFSLTRSLHPLVVFASSDDGSLAGIADVTSDERRVTIALNPLATATGRLVDARTKKPLPNRDIQYGARVYMGDASERMSWRTSGGGSAKTDDAGRFTLEHIIVGRTIAVDVLIDPKGHSSQNVAELRMRTAAPIDLGDVAYGQDRRTVQSLQERVMKDFAAITTPLAEYTPHWPRPMNRIGMCCSYSAIRWPALRRIYWRRFTMPKARSLQRPLTFRSFRLMWSAPRARKGQRSPAAVELL